MIFTILDLREKVVFFKILFFAFMIVKFDILAICAPMSHVKGDVMVIHYFKLNIWSLIL